MGALFLMGTAPLQAQDLDMDAIFRCQAEDDEGKRICKEGQELIVMNCTVCHTFVPIVLQQFDRAAWRGLLDRHRDRASQLSEEQFDLLLEYLSQNFNPDLPPPEVPAEMLNNWTAY